MGFYEDDRIRRKNATHNEAFKIYETLKTLGYTHSEVRDHAKNAISYEKDSYRNEIYRNILLIVGENGESKSSDS